MFAKLLNYLPEAENTVVWIYAEKNWYTVHIFSAQGVTTNHNKTKAVVG